MKLYRAEIVVSSSQRKQLIDITEQARDHVRRSGVKEGICSLYAHGATSALMIQENADPAIALDVVDCLQNLVPAGRWRHDRIDSNADAHIQAGIVGPSETVPIREGCLGLSTWQNVFLCDLDGPRSNRRVQLTIIGE